MSHRISAGLVVICLLAGAAPAGAQQPRTTTHDAMGAFPCPSGDASCGNGLQAAASKRHQHKHREQAENPLTQNTEVDSNPNQKIEDAPPGDVDEGVVQDIQQMNDREAMPHDVAQPK
jgi:hypothetical protein